MTLRAESVMQQVVSTVTGLTTTGAQVYRARAYALPAVPALSVEQGDDTPVAEPGNSNTLYMDNELVVQITAVVSSTSNVETELNQIREEVYAAMMADTTLGLAYVYDVRWLGADAPDISDEGERPVASVTTNWAIYYRHSYTDAGA